MKKIIFSLMRLITILALAFVVPSAMAANNIGSSLDMTSDISHKGGLQVRHPGDDTDFPFTLRFDKPVDLKAANLSISIFDEAGAFLSTPTGQDTAAQNAGQFSVAQGTDLRDWTVTIADIEGAARQVKVRVAEGVASSDPFEENATQQVDYTIELLGADASGNPDIYKIALVGEPFATITTATFMIHILLSEAPKDGFTQDLVEVTDATVSSVVKLVSPGSSATVNGTTVRASWRDNTLHFYLVTLETQPGDKTVTIKVKNFAGMEKPTNTNTQYVRKPDAALTEGRDKLTVKTKRDSLRTGGVTVTVNPPENTIIPADTAAITTAEKPKSDATAADAAGAAAKAADTSVRIPEEGQIYISEIMFAGGGFLPQWIEISNGSRTEQVNLSGWTLTVENSTADADVFVSAKAKFRIPEGTRIDPSGQHDTPSTLLVVTKRGRTNLDGRMAAESGRQLGYYQTPLCVAERYGVQNNAVPPSETYRS